MRVWDESRVRRDYRGRFARLRGLSRTLLSKEFTDSFRRAPGDNTSKGASDEQIVRQLAGLPVTRGSFYEQPEDFFTLEDIRDRAGMAPWEPVNVTNMDEKPERFLAFVSNIHRWVGHAFPGAESTWNGVATMNGAEPTRLGLAHGLTSIIDGSQDYEGNLTFNRPKLAHTVLHETLHNISQARIWRAVGYEGHVVHRGEDRIPTEEMPDDLRMAIVGVNANLGLEELTVEAMAQILGPTMLRRMRDSRQLDNDAFGMAYASVMYEDVPESFTRQHPYNRMRFAIEPMVRQTGVEPDEFWTYLFQVPPHERKLAFLEHLANAYNSGTMSKHDYTVAWSVVRWDVFSNRGWVDDTLAHGRPNVQGMPRSASAQAIQFAEAMAAKSPPKTPA